MKIYPGKNIISSVTKSWEPMKNANADFDIYTQFLFLLKHFDFLMYLFRNLRQIYYHVFAHIMQIVLGSLQKNVKIHSCRKEITFV